MYHGGRNRAQGRDGQRIQGSKSPTNRDISFDSTLDLYPASRRASQRDRDEHQRERGMLASSRGTYKRRAFLGRESPDKSSAFVKIKNPGDGSTQTSPSSSYAGKYANWENRRSPSTSRSASSNKKSVRFPPSRRPSESVGQTVGKSAYAPQSEYQQKSERTDKGQAHRKSTKPQQVATESAENQVENSRESLRSVRRRVRGLQAQGMHKTEIEIEREDDANLSTAGRTNPHVLSSTVFSGHDGQILSIFRQGGVLFSASADGTVKAWDINSRTCLATFSGHRRSVWGMEASSRTLITSSADGTVRFWDIETAQCLHVIDLHLPVRDIVIVGDFLAAATSSADIEVIALNGMARLGALQGHLLAVCSLTSLDGGTTLVSGSHDTFIRVWNPNTGSCDAVLRGHSGTVGALSTTSSRSPHFSAGRGFDCERKREALIVSGSGDATVRVWGRAGQQEGGDWVCLAVLQGHRHGVWAVHGTPESCIFATGGGDAAVHVWAPTTTACTETGLHGETLDAPERAWECVGGVRGTVGAVGAVLMTENALLFGTSEALIARFPLELCMPTRR